MKEVKQVTVRPPIFKNREDRDRARMLLARKCLWELIAAAKSQVDPLRWLKEGGVELEEVALCLDHGGMHPYLKEWKHKRAGAANRPSPTAREHNARSLMCLATVALDRVFSLGRGEAREIVAKAAAKLFDNPPTAKALEHWQDNQPPLSPAAEQVLATAIAQSRVHEPGGQDRLANYFIGIAAMHMNPGLRIDAE
jgi:hypothetical protein